MSKFIAVLSPAERGAKKRKKSNPWRDKFVLSNKAKNALLEKNKKDVEDASQNTL